LPPASTLPPAATSTPTRTPTPTPTATDTPSSGITGRATRNGAPASGLNLELRRCDASSCTTAATSATRGDGRYTFAGAPSLGAGESYYVQYLNTSDSPNPGPGNLYSWFGNEIAAYNAGAAAAGGDFDIADVALASPPDEAVVALPATFCWTPRGVPGDNYRFTLYDMFTSETVTSGYLGSAACYTLQALSAGWPADEIYMWWVEVAQGSDPAATPYNYGYSYGDRLVTIARCADI
jgi:hypothetical protein